MIKIAQITGISLILLGVAAFLLTGMVHKTSLIPCAPGILILISAFIAKVNVKVGMHMAVLFALIGVGGIMPIRKHGLNFSESSVVTSFCMILICLVFIILAVRSFIAARRAK